MKRYYFWHFTCFAFLLLLTQVGAFSYLLCLLIAYYLKIKKRMVRLLLNITLYSLFTFVFIPILAPVFGREPIHFTEQLKPVNYWLTVALNRHYVVPELNELLASIAQQLQRENQRVVLYVLDANFPFFDGYPLLPHLSHHDGRKVDLSYIYQDELHVVSNLKPARSGYGVFEAARQGEEDTAKFCKKQGYWQYDYPQYLTFGQPDVDLVFSDAWNRILLEQILAHQQVVKVFIEPHLKLRLGLHDKRIRFHGCRAVRHDDHIHIQI